MNSSTSLEELPSAIVWISTRGGANSGKTSTFALGTCATPKAMIAAAAKMTSQRKRRLLDRRSSASVAPGDLELGAVDLGRPDRHDLGADGRTVRERTRLPSMRATSTRGARYSSGLGLV